MFDSNFDKKDFFNCDQMNETGAKQWSKIMSKRLNIYLNSLTTTTIE